MFDTGRLADRLDAAGPALTALLDSLVPSDLATADLFAVTQAFDRVASWAQAGGLAVLAEVLRRDSVPQAGPGCAPSPPRPSRGRPWAGEFTIAEIACELGLTETSAGLRVSLAHSLDTRHPWVLDALAAGRIDLAKARILADETRHLDEQTAGEVTLRMLGRAEHQNTTRLRQRVRLAAAHADPAAARRKTKAAKRDRRAWLSPGDPDGLSLFGADLPNSDAAQLFATIDQAARALRAEDRANARATKAAMATNAASPQGGHDPGETLDPDRPGRPNSSAGARGSADPSSEGDSEGAGDPREPQIRTLDQCRADALLDLVCGDWRYGTPSAGPDGLVNITVPLSTLLGDALQNESTVQDDGAPHAAHQAGTGTDTGTDTGTGMSTSTGTDTDTGTDEWDRRDPIEPADLPGDVQWFGPACASTVRELALAELRRMAGGRVGVRWVVVDDAGHAVAASGTSYQVPPLLRSVIEVRDLVCRFPGCSRRAEQCDADHTIPYPRGATAECNLTCLCRRHHRVKTHGRWKVRSTSRGLAWTSPHGSVYLTHPAVWAEPSDPGWWNDPSQPPPDDPSDAWTPAQYEAWVDRVCAEADALEPTRADEPGGAEIDATGPDLPTTWWAEALPPWESSGETPSTASRAAAGRPGL